MANDGYVMLCVKLELIPYEHTLNNKWMSHHKKNWKKNIT